MDRVVDRAQVLAIVPARAGSKGIPRKNVQLFAGHPLLAWSVAAGVQAQLVDRVIISTDDDAFAEVARAYGAEVPFMRPRELAEDDTTDLPVYQHALSWLAENEDYRPDVVVQLRPTSPIRPSDCVDGSVARLLEAPQADSVRGVVPSGQNPYKMWRLDGDAPMQPLLEGPPEAYNMPRQALPLTYWQTGHVDVVRAATIMEKHSMTGDVILPWRIDQRYTVDIDSPLDWKLAELVLEDEELDCIWPSRARRPLPAQVALVVLDFDGVMTDNRVWVDSEGRESVAAHRGDGWGLARLREAGIDVFVLSTEKNPVVAARCAKLDIPLEQGLDDKGAALDALLADRGVDPARVVYVGNDVNDLDCFERVGCALVVADAHPTARQAADRVLEQRGGHGAVRELCDILLQRSGPKLQEPAS